MAKSKKAANFILLNKLESLPNADILEAYKKEYPDDEMLLSDISNGYQLIKKGYKIKTPLPKQITRVRRNPLKDGDYVDAASCVAATVSRFSKEDRVKFLSILRDKLAV